LESTEAVLYLMQVWLKISFYKRVYVEELSISLYFLGDILEAFVMEDALIQPNFYSGKKAVKKCFFPIELYLPQVTFIARIKNMCGIESL
jgi:hypothetical protein